MGDRKSVHGAVPDRKAIAAIIGQHMKTVRASRGLSQSELATLLGVHRLSISHRETGDRMPDLYAVYATADALGVAVSTLLPRLDDVRMD